MAKRALKVSILEILYEVSRESADDEDTAVSDSWTREEIIDAHSLAVPDTNMVAN
jgi:hypothetical protein